MISVASQEVQPLSGISVVSTDETRGTAWRRAVKVCVSKLGDYVTVGAKQMIGVFLIVFIKAEHYPFVHNASLADVGTRFMRTGGNKGGVACRFTIYQRSMCFDSRHLTAHNYNFERRNQDYPDVVRKAIFSLQNPSVSPFSYRDIHVSEQELKRIGSRYDS